MHVPENVEKLESLCPRGAAGREKYGYFKKKNRDFLYDLTTPPLGIYPKGQEAGTHVYGGIIPNSREVEATRVTLPGSVTT